MFGILPNHDEEEDGESQERRASIAEKGQWYANDRHQTDDHAHIDKDMEEEYGHDRIAIETGETRRLPLGHCNQPLEQPKID